jgi:hypothetical protein
MKELFAALLFAAVLMAIVTSSSSNGQGDATRMPDRGDLWNDLRDRPEVPRLRDARYSSPRNMPVTVASPAVLPDPARRFAGAPTEFAAELGGAAGPGLGAPWLVAETARMALPGTLHGAEGGGRGAPRRAPPPAARPDPTQPPQGALSAALGLLEKAGLDALVPTRQSQIGAAKKFLPDLVPEPAALLRATHRDRAPSRPI